MSVTTVTEGVPEHVTDRAIEKAEEDRFGHQDFVERLMTIVRRTETPTNVALFGRWGSGKTGISHRLRAEVDALDRFEFAYFDAFKFARLPLLRRFLVQIAEQIGDEETVETYRRLLYEKSQSVHFDRPSERSREIFGRWAVRAVWILASLIVLFDALALFLASEDQIQVAVGLIGALFPVLLPAGLIGVATVLGARFLTATTTVESPDSEEQFETLFSRLLCEQRIGDGKKTLIVFVDELDRCSATEVARTLESLKTFLGEKGCIFIVAADRNVLEHALTRRVRQATPPDASNPYYSAGSAYLDKIFQYQIHLPPLFPGRLTGFALRLLEDVGGTWEEVEAKEDVVSVLLPVTVRSPRRVKVLLNAFAQAFALALARAASGGLDEKVRSRAAEVAKLVALQIEFPLFAADLTLNPDLPALVLVCADALAQDGKPDLGKLDALQGVPDFVRERAISYAKGELPTAEILNDGGGEELRKAQGGDLIDYLRQTALVDGPRVDLVHFEGLGLSAGIDEALAIELNDLALKNRPELVRDRLKALDDEDERRRAFLWLRSLVRESRGNDADNAIRALLIAFPAAGAAMPRVATDLLAAVHRYDRRRGLADDELPSALELAIIGRGPYLQGLILERPRALEDPFRSFALDRAPLLIEDHPGPLGRMLMHEMLDQPAAAVARLRRADAELRAHLADCAANAIRDEVGRIEAALSRDDVEQSLVEELTAELTLLVEAVATVAGHLLTRQDQLTAEVILTPVLARVRGSSGLEAIDAVLDAFPQSRTAGFAIALGRWLSRQPTGVFVRLAPTLNGRLLRGHAVFHLGEALARLWVEAVGEESELAERGIAEIGKLAAEGVAVASERVREEARRTLRAAVASEAEIERRRAQVDLLEQMVKDGILAASEAAEEVTGFVAQMAAETPPAGLEGALAPLLSQSLGRVAGESSEEGLENVRFAIAGSPWLSGQSPYAETMLLQIEAAASADAPAAKSPIEPESIVQLSQDYGERFQPGLAIWLESFRPRPATAIKALEPQLGRTVPAALRPAVEAYVSRQTPAGCYRLVRDLIDPDSSKRPSQSLLRQLGIQKADPERVATAIVDRFERATSNPERETALSIWRAFAPSEPRVRRRLIKAVFIPLAGLGVGGYDICRRYLDLCREPPYGTKNQLQEALANPPNRRLRRQMPKRLAELGLKPLGGQKK